MIIDYYSLFVCTIITEIIINFFNSTNFNVDEDIFQQLDTK